MSEGIFHCHQGVEGAGGRGYRRAQLEESRDAAKYAVFTKKNYLTSHVNRANVSKL